MCTCTKRHDGRGQQTLLLQSNHVGIFLVSTFTFTIHSLTNAGVPDISIDMITTDAAAEIEGHCHCLSRKGKTYQALLIVSN